MLLFYASSSFGQASAQIAVPNFDDRYSELVKMLEAGQTNINYQELRKSFIKSEQFKVASKSFDEFERLKKEMYSEMGKKNYQEIIELTQRMLSIDYTSMIAHKILRQTYKIVGDTAKASQYKAIQFGLLNSIVKNGDGKSCATAWPVIQIAEEYFILQMLGAELLKQTLDRNNGICDKMEVKTDEGRRVYYFETSQVFDGYRNFGIK